MNIIEKIRDAVKGPEAQADGKIYWDAQVQSYLRRPHEEPIAPEDQDVPQAWIVHARRMKAIRDRTAKAKMNSNFKRRLRKEQYRKSTLKAQVSVLEKGEEYWAARGQLGMFNNVRSHFEKLMDADEAAS